jgi:hypothetical protein
VKQWQTESVQEDAKFVPSLPRESPAIAAPDRSQHEKSMQNAAEEQLQRVLKKSKAGVAQHSQKNENNAAVNRDRSVRAVP